MTLTYTSAADRDALRTRRSTRVFSLSDLMMAATSGLALLAIALAYTGRLRRFEAAETQHADIRTVNLNSVQNAAEIEPALAVIFPNPTDRRFAARELFRFIDSERTAGGEQSHVGAIMHATVRIDTVEREPQLDTLARRAQAARDTARTFGANQPATMPLFTSSDLGAVKPFFVVRTRETLRSRLVWFGGFYLLGFPVIALVWRYRRTRGDRVLLAAAHLLTAIGFAVLLSRADPLRDTLLFVRYAEG